MTTSFCTARAMVDSAMFYLTGTLYPARFEYLAQAVVAVLGPRSFFGEGCLAGQPLHVHATNAPARPVARPADRGAALDRGRRDPGRWAGPFQRPHGRDQRRQLEIGHGPVVGQAAH